MSGREHIGKKSRSPLNSTSVPNPLQRRRLKAPPQIQSGLSQQQNASSIPEQLDRASQFNHNFLDVPVEALETAPASSPVQRQLISGELGNNSQPQVAPQVEANPEQVEETVEQEELPKEDASLNQESPNTEGEGESVPSSVQPEAESEEQQPQKPLLQAQLEKASRFGYNALDVPVNSPGTPSPRVQRKLTLSNSENEYQPEVIERANPVLNGLHQFKTQQFAQEPSVQRQ